MVQNNVVVLASGKCNTTLLNQVLQDRAEFTKNMKKAPRKRIPKKGKTVMLDKDIRAISLAESELANDITDYRRQQIEEKIDKIYKKY